MTTSGARIAGGLAFATLVACSAKKSAPEAAHVDAAPPSVMGRVSAAATSSEAIDFTRDPDRCTLGYRGALLDVGDASMRGHYGARLTPSDVEEIERDGATWGRVHGRTLSLTFVAPEDGNERGIEPSTLIEARVRGIAAKSASVYLNGKAIGQWTFVKGEARIVSARAPISALIAGENEVKLHFNGARSPDPQAEIDWIHVGSGDPDPAYAAPTREAALLDATLGGEVIRSFSLAGPGYARCATTLPRKPELEVALGTMGGEPGARDAEVTVRLLRDRAAASTLGTFHLGASDANAWRRVTMPIDASAFAKNPIAMIDFEVTHASKGVRVLFGAARVVDADRAPPAAPIPNVRGAILVVIGNVGTRSVSAYGGADAMPEFAAIAHGGFVFDRHRVSTSFAAGALAAMITGESARDARVDDREARLPSSLTTIADAARQAGVLSAFFTANPTTASAFGFDRGWHTFEQVLPGDEAPGTNIFDDAAKWIDAHKSDRFLVVVHARGGHPPWNATADDLKKLPPANYIGGIDAKHAGELFAKARHVPPLFRMTDADRERASALYGLALSENDAALGRLLTALKNSGRDQDTALLLTSDTANDDRARIPFGDGESLDESVLTTPLIVRAPGANTSDVTHVDRATSDADIARTILDALGLAPPSAFEGRDLWTLAQDDRTERAQIATLDAHFSIREGELLLLGSAGEPAPHRALLEPTLCDRTLEPSCTQDVRALYPIAASVLQRRAFDALVSAKPKVTREPARIDAVAAANLRAWGEIEPGTRE